MFKIFFSVIIFAISIQAEQYNYFLQNGWQMMGAVETIRYIPTFNDNCIKSIWRFDRDTKTWLNYTPNDKEKSTLTLLNKSDGFWVEANGNCLISHYITIIDNYNQSKRLEVIDNQGKLNGLYSKYLSQYPDVETNFNNNYVLFVRSEGEEDSNIKDIKIKEIKHNSRYSEIFVETKVINGDCKNLRFNAHAKLEFKTIEKIKNVIFSENLTLEDCNGEEINSDVNETFMEIPFREISFKSNNANTETITQKKLEVVQNLEAFEYLYYHHINNSASNKELPVIDFEKETLIALFMGEYSSTGYNIKVTKVNESDSHIEVEVENTLLGNYCLAGDMITTPFTFITIPKTEKEIIFKEYTNINDCEPLL